MLSSTPWTILCIAALGFGAVTVASVARHAWRRRDFMRRQGERDEYQRGKDSERAQRAQAAVTELINRFFPYVREAALTLINSGLTPKLALKQALKTVQGVHLGVSDSGFDVLLPEEH